MAVKVNRPLRLLTTRSLSGRDSMALDLSAFKDHSNGLVGDTIRFYSWDPPAVSIGYSQDPDAHLDTRSLIEMGWDIVKRPTGGGIAFHGPNEVSYSIVTSINGSSLVDSYKKLSRSVVLGLKNLGIDASLAEKGRNRHSRVCFSFPASWEITYCAKKLAASAQKRGNLALLQHGSIYVSRIPDAVLSCIKGGDKDLIQSSYISIEEILGKRPSFEEVVRALSSAFIESSS